MHEKNILCMQCRGLKTERSGFAHYFSFLCPKLQLLLFYKLITQQLTHWHSLRPTETCYTAKPYHIYVSWNRNYLLFMLNCDEKKKENTINAYCFLSRGLFRRDIIVQVINSLCFFPSFMIVWTIKSPQYLESVNMLR